MDVPIAVHDFMLGCAYGSASDCALMIVPAAVPMPVLVAVLKSVPVAVTMALPTVVPLAVPVVVPVAVLAVVPATMPSWLSHCCACMMLMDVPLAVPTVVPVGVFTVERTAVLVAGAVGVATAIPSFQPFLGQGHLLKSRDQQSGATLLVRSRISGQGCVTVCPSAQPPRRTSLTQGKGEFYIAEKDFLQYFQTINVAHILHSPATDIMLEAQFDGASAGGCNNFITWRNNPLFVLSHREKAVEVFLTMQQVCVDAVGVGIAMVEVALFIAFTPRLQSGLP